MTEEIVAGPAPAGGTMVATLPAQPFPRRVLNVAVSCSSATQTVATVHVDSTYSPYVDGTSTGNGDAGGAAGILLPAGAHLLVRWLAATIGSEGRAMVTWTAA